MEVKISRLSNAGLVHLLEIDEADGDTIGITALSAEEWQEKRRIIFDRYRDASKTDMLDIISALTVIVEKD